MRAAIVLALAVALTGCAGKMVYVPDDGGPTDHNQFYRDQAACNMVIAQYKNPQDDHQEAFNRSLGNNRMHRDCMRAKGWVLVRVKE